jgi:hypothetical protein
MENNPMHKAPDTQKSPIRYQYMLSPRCGAKTRQGSPCLSPAVRSKKRCRMHGGAQGSGAPLGSQNALKHGHTTRQVKDLRHRTQALLKASHALLSSYSESLVQ